MPKVEYLRAAQQFDAMTDNWGGATDSVCFDGMPVAFERIKGGVVTSGIGNASCSEHYRAIDQLAAAAGPLDEAEREKIIIPGVVALHGAISQEEMIVLVQDRIFAATIGDQMGRCRRR
ncbi:hypothetical protein C5708_08760 [Caulobacter sp. CCUG 60055]|uniref:hypothetical protein n=1 Tax=Caulobacter sp. CCUG 60055 TaxID=2100090 RepID=UPI001FA6F8FD|nr:hypothetical protein [Caulobacter sp. CCUG 60055]MBQ1541946.1 hypothetical protein [Caulobacteraceae bacterium]MCI3180342.1 hypothetical protein [Caulobacter sp. CCUG 60055]